MTVKTNKPPKTPTLEMSNQSADAATDLLAAGVPLGDVAAAQQQAAVAAADGTSTGTPAPVTAETPAPVQSSAQAQTPDQSPLVAHLTKQNLELNTQLQAATLELALTRKDLEAAQVKATENAALLSDLTKATCAAINITNIQMGKPTADLAYLDAPTAVAMYKTAQDTFLKAFKPGQRSSNLAAVGDSDGDTGAEKAPTREEVQAAQRVGKK